MLAMQPWPSTTYARTMEGAYLALQVFGEGPTDLVLPMVGGFSVDAVWDEPDISSFLTRLSTFSRVITFDPRGFGSSERVDPAAAPAVQIWVDDLRTILDHVGAERAAILVWGEWAPAAILFVATYPDRVSSLVLVNGTARFLRNQQCPWGMPTETLPAYIEAIRSTWGTGAVTEFVAPGMVQTDEARRRWAKAERLSGTPNMAAVVRAQYESDVTDVLSAIQTPTLLISRLGNPHLRPEHSRFLASRIRDSRLVELSGDDHIPFSGRSDEILDEVEEFTTGSRPVPVLDRVLATVLFTDIVSSTERAERLGDRRWRETMDRYDEVVRQQLARFRGHHVKSTGDGSLATFDGPARAIECARAIVIGVRDQGLDVRAGLHTGEMEIRGEDVSGLAVNIAARVASLAGAGEIFVSRTVTDLVAGSGIGFRDRGDHELKGVSGSWKLFEVRAT
jgi:class 3 adenylate cyclase